MIEFMFEICPFLYETIFLQDYKDIVVILDGWRIYFTTLHRPGRTHSVPVDDDHP
jgi:hypothetical protein